MDKPITLGGIYACISGDHRYATRIVASLFPEDNTVIIQRLENGAVGGMDGNGAAHGFEVSESVIVDAKPGAIVKAIKNIMDDTVKQYGKPTKRFTWYGTEDKGLSVNKCKAALEFAVELEKKRGDYRRLST